jgi:hypothetical protein
MLVLLMAIPAHAEPKNESGKGKRTTTARQAKLPSGLDGNGQLEPLPPATADGFSSQVGQRSSDSRQRTGQKCAFLRAGDGSCECECGKNLRLAAKSGL